MRIHVQRDANPRSPAPQVAQVAPSRISGLANRRLVVSSSRYLLCWWFLFGMHFFNGSLAIAFSSSYLFFSLPSVYPSTAVLRIPINLLRATGWSYTGLAVFHWISLVRMIKWSFQRKRLTFVKPLLQATKPPFQQQWLSTMSTRLEGCERSFWRPWNRLYGIDGWLGVNGKYFDVGFFLREGLEIGLQTYQARQLSGAVRRPWLTHLAVATIVLNAISAPFVDAVMRQQSKSARRLVSLLVDMCLDMSCAVVIPLAVAYPYIAAYDSSIGSLPIALVNDDIWYTASLSEIRQFAVTSVPDFLATMIPHGTIYMCLNMVKKLVRREAQESSSSPCPLSKRIHSERSMMPIIPAKRTASYVITKRCYQRVHLAAQLLLIAWAVGVIVVHIRAHSIRTVRGCRLPLAMWLAVGEPCAVMQINCYRDQIQGSSAEIKQLIEHLDRGILKKLIITHCPLLEIPPLLGEFNEITDMELYNSTLVAWPKEAAATPTTLSSLVVLSWLASPYVAFPAGLLHDNLPPSFDRLYIAKSNLTELPDELGSLWAKQYINVFSVQFTQLSRLPSSFHELEMRKIRLVSNNLTVISNDAFATKRLSILHLSGNPLQAWPTSIGDTFYLSELFAEHTEISNLTQQVIEWWEVRQTGVGVRRGMLSLAGSPLCEKEPADDPYGVCGTDYGSSSGTHRWDLITAQRPLDG